MTHCRYCGRFARLSSPHCVWVGGVWLVIQVVTCGRCEPGLVIAIKPAGRAEP